MYSPAGNYKVYTGCILFFYTKRTNHRECNCWYATRSPGDCLAKSYRFDVPGFTSCKI